MKNHSILSINVKRGLLRFSERVSKGLTRPEFKFVAQMLYGILSAQSCHLSKIARSLNEKSSLKKTIERLSRNLATFSGREQLLRNYMKKVKGGVSDKTLLLFDGSDIAKPCSPRMEYISPVYDGSTGKIAEGYSTLGVTALTPERKMPVSVYTRVYSVSEPGFVSEDDEVLKALDFVGEHFSKRNIRVFDRGIGKTVQREVQFEIPQEKWHGGGLQDFDSARQAALPTGQGFESGRLQRIGKRPAYAFDKSEKRRCTVTCSHNESIPA